MSKEEQAKRWVRKIREEEDVKRWARAIREEAEASKKDEIIKEIEKTAIWADHEKKDMEKAFKELGTPISMGITEGFTKKVLEEGLPLVTTTRPKKGCAIVLFPDGSTLSLKEFVSKRDTTNGKIYMTGIPDRDEPMIDKSKKAENTFMKELKGLR